MWVAVSLIDAAALANNLGDLATALICGGFVRLFGSLGRCLAFRRGAASDAFGMLSLRDDVRCCMRRVRFRSQGSSGIRKGEGVSLSRTFSRRFCFEFRPKLINFLLRGLRIFPRIAAFAGLWGRWGR